MLSDLKAAIENWVDAKKNRSLSMLANRTNKAYSTIRYIVQGNRLPSESTVLAITDVIMDTDERVRFFNKHYPDIGEMMEKAYSQSIRQQPHMQRLSWYLHREPHNRIFNMAATSRGVSKETIRVLLGDFGVQALSDMLEDGILVERENQQITYHSETWAFSNPDDILAQLKASIDHFDRDLLGTDGAALVNMTASVNEDTINLIKNKIKAFAQELSEIKNAPEAEGSIPFFCNLIYCLYDKSLWEKKSEGDPQ